MSIYSHDELIESMVYKALLIPVTVMGVNYYYFMLEVVILFCVFIFSKQLIILLLILPLHTVGVLLQKIDPYFIPLIKVHALFLKSTPNRMLWGGTSYAS